METMNKCSVIIRGEGLMIDREISGDLADELVVRILSQNNGTTRDKAAETTIEGGVESVAGFLKECGAGRSVERIVAIGWWLKEKKSINMFGRREVKEMLEEAGYGVPKNLSRDLAWSVDVGWIVRKEGQKGVYYLSQKGREVVEAKFPEQEVVGTVVRRSTRAKLGTR